MNTLPTKTVYTVTVGEWTTTYASKQDAADALLTGLGDGLPVASEKVDVPMTIDYLDGDGLTDRERLGKAFRSLRSTHVTSMGLVCCSGCMWAEKAEQMERTGKGLLGFNNQSWTSFDSGSRAEAANLTDGLYLQHGGDSARAVEALKAAGLPTEWDGDDSQAIVVWPSKVDVCSRKFRDDHSDYCRACRSERAVADRYFRRLGYETVTAAERGERITLDGVRAFRRSNTGSTFAEAVRAGREREAEWQARLAAEKKEA